GRHGAFAAAGHAPVGAGVAAARIAGDALELARARQAEVRAGALAQPGGVGARVLEAHAHCRVLAGLVESGRGPAALLEADRRGAVPALRRGAAGGGG